jgi:lysophospholipase L1-like esterase
MCFYPLQGTVYVDDLSFVIDRRKPARFVVVGDSISEGYDATNYANCFVSVVQSNFTQAVCNDSGSYNTTGSSVSLLPEILAYQPGTAVLMIGGNDLQFGYPTAQWQSNYSNLVAQLQANGVKVKHCLPTPRSIVDLRPLKTWISANYPAQDIIDTWTPLVTSNSKLNPAYDNYDNDHVHPNDAGHLLIGQIIRTNLP